VAAHLSVEFQVSAANFQYESKTAVGLKRANREEVAAKYVLLVFCDAGDFIATRL
jgi:long-subunit fatty acid transport protein